MTSADFRSFYAYNRSVYGYSGATLAQQLPEVIRSWLSTPLARAKFNVDGLTPYECICLMQAIEKSIRRKWAQKAAKTRAANADRRDRRQRKASDPLPVDDSRNLLFIF